MLEMFEKGHNRLFIELGKEDKGVSGNMESGAIATDRFRSIFDSKVKIKLNANENDAFDFLFDPMGRKLIEYRRLEAGFVNFVQIQGKQYKDLIEQKSFEENPKEYWGRKIYVNFDDYFRRN